MLVVSRKQNQTVTFPHLGISVEILRIAGKAVSVGVKAPADVRILRGELANATSTSQNAAESHVHESKTTHALRNQLNKASLALHLVQKQLRSGKTDGAERTVAATLESLAELDRQASSLTGIENGNSSIQCEAASSKPRALLVEDNLNERELLAGYLRLSGYEVDTVEDGVAAVEFLNRQRPNVVVMDMLMPRMNGSQTVRIIQVVKFTH